MTKGVIYARYSEGPRQTDQSIEGQVADCRSYAESHNIKIIGVYADRHISGKSTAGRDEFMRMIQDAEQHLFDVVIVWKIDRFGRDRADIAIYKSKLKKAGVQLKYARESVPDGPEGIILESVLEGLAEYYSADLRQKVMRGMKESAKKGQYPSAVPIGYKKDKDKHIIVDEEKADAVREAFKLCADGVRQVDILKMFEARGIVSKRGTKIDKATLHRMLRNRRYTGKFEIMDVVIETEPIVSDELFEAAAARLNSGKHNAAGKGDYMLSCKCYCGYCGKLMRGESGTSKSGKVYNYYKCATKKTGGECESRPLSKDIFEKIVARATVDYVLTDEMIDHITERVMEIQAKDREFDRTEVLKKQLDACKKKQKNIMDAIEDGAGSQMVARLNELEAEEESLEVEISREEIKAPLLSYDLVHSWLCLYRYGDIDDDDFRRRLLDTFVARVEVTNEEAVIYYNASPLNKSDDTLCSNKVSLVDQTGVEPVSKSLFPVLLLS